MMANAGGAWDNSKKYIEIEGAHGGKHTPVHVACVVGDTVGDPFKDTSGPSLNILIKLMSIISLTMAPMIAGNGDWPPDWWKGLFPIAVMVLGTYIVYRCFWKHAETVMPVNCVDQGCRGSGTKNGEAPDDVRVQMNRVSTTSEQKIRYS